MTIQGRNPFLTYCSAAAESFRRAAAAAAEGKLLSAFSLGRGGLYEAIPKMCLENGVGFAVSENADPWEFGRAGAGGILAESAEPLPGAAVVGLTCPEPVIDLGRLGRVPLAGLKRT